MIDILNRIDANRLTSAELTARLELNLSEIEDGEMTSYDFMKNISGYVEEVVNKAKDIDFDELYPDENPLGTCPKCKNPVYEKAWFYGCAEAIKKKEQEIVTS